MVIIGEINQKDECVIEWLIKDFRSLSTKDGSYYTSPLFVFANLSWFLQVFPNERKRETSEGYIGLYLRRVSPGLSIPVQCILGVKTVNERLDPERRLTYIFKEKCSRGFPTFLSRADILLKKYRITSSNALTLVCNLKASKICCKEISIFRKNKFLQDYKELFLKKIDCDVIINVKGQEFPAHKIILSARSPVFQSTFQPKRKKLKTDMVNIEEFEPSVFSDFLCFLYCGDTEIITCENVFSLFAAADKYDVNDLSDTCLEFMKENLSVDTFCDTITWALKHSESELIALTTDFFTTNSQKIIRTSKWGAYLASNPIKCNELLIKALEPLKT